MNAQKAHSLGVRSEDVRITTRPNSGTWVAWVPDEERGQRILTEGDVFSLCQWRALLKRFEDAALANTTVHLPELIANKFGGSRSEARRCLAQGGVFLDDAPLGIEHMDALPVSLLAGRTLRIGKLREVKL